MVHRLNVGTLDDSKRQLNIRAESSSNKTLVTNINLPEKLAANPRAFCAELVLNRT